MKRWFALLMLLVTALCAANAQAEMKRYAISSDANPYFECMDYADEMPGEVREAFSGLLLEGDTVLSGTYYATWYKNTPGVMQSQKALMLVQRGSKTLVMSACWENGAWNACIESDNFVAPGAKAQATTLARYYIDTECDAYPAITCGEEIYRLKIDEAGRVRVDTYIRTESDGSKVSIFSHISGFSYRRTKGNDELESWSEYGAAPERLCAWTMDTFPKDVGEIQQYILAHPVALGVDEVILHGGNFRMQPTSNSKSMGQYSAKAKLLDTKMGTKWPWYHVQVGHLTGWVSGNYVTTDSQDRLHYYGMESGAGRVARAKREISLRTLPDGETKQTIPAGTLMHVVIENDGWAHVIIPRGEITWKTDWDGAYGFVKADEVEIGLSVADVVYRPQ